MGGCSTKTKDNIMNILYDSLGDTTLSNSNIRTKDLRTVNAFIGDGSQAKTAFLAAVNKAVVNKGALPTYIADDRETDVMGLSDAWYFMGENPDTATAAMTLIQAVYPNVVDVYIEDYDCEMYVVMDDTEEAISLHDMSEGYCRLLKIIIGCGIVKNGVVLIDDVDEFFPHEAYAAIWDFLAHTTQNLNNQVLIAVSDSNNVRSYTAWLDRMAGLIEGAAFIINEKDNADSRDVIGTPLRRALR